MLDSTGFSTSVIGPPSELKRECCSSVIIKNSLESLERLTDKAGKPGVIHETLQWFLTKYFVLWRVKLKDTIEPPPPRCCLLLRCCVSHKNERTIIFCRLTPPMVTWLQSHTVVRWANRNCPLLKPSEVRHVSSTDLWMNSVSETLCKYISGEKL